MKFSWKEDFKILSNVPLIIKKRSIVYLVSCYYDYSYLPVWSLIPEVKWYKYVEFSKFLNDASLYQQNNLSNINRNIVPTCLSQFPVFNTFQGWLSGLFRLGNGSSTEKRSQSKGYVQIFCNEKQYFQYFIR